MLRHTQMGPPAPNRVERHFQMSKQFNSKYLNDCVEHALERCQQVTPVQADVIRLVRWAFDHSHETNPGVCLDLRKQYEKRVLKLRGLKSWERSLVVAAR